MLCREKAKQSKIAGEERKQKNETKRNANDKNDKVFNCSTFHGAQWRCALKISIRIVNYWANRPEQIRNTLLNVVA